MPIKASAGLLALPPGIPMRDRLMLAGEHLLGDFGVEGVSMRQVSALAGTRNNYAVQYHFKDLDGLIHAIVALRTPEIESARGQALAEIGSDGEDMTRVLLETFFKPLLGMVDIDGQPRFARFMLALHRAADGWRPLDDLFYLMPTTERILDLLHADNPTIPAPVIWQRLRPISVMVLTYTCSITHGRLPDSVKMQVVEGLLDMSVAALRVPVRQIAASNVYGFIY